MQERKFQHKIYGMDDCVAENIRRNEFNMTEGDMHESSRNSHLFAQNLSLIAILTNAT